MKGFGGGTHLLKRLFSPLFQIGSHGETGFEATFLALYMWSVFAEPVLTIGTPLLPRSGPKGEAR